MSKVEVKAWMAESKIVENEGLNCACVRVRAETRVTSNPYGCQGEKTRLGTEPCEYCIAIVERPVSDSFYATMADETARAVVDAVKAEKEADKVAWIERQAELEEAAKLAAQGDKARPVVIRREQACGKGQSLAKVAHKKLMDKYLLEHDWLLAKKENLALIGKGIGFLLIGDGLDRMSEYAINYVKTDFADYIASLEKECNP